MSGSRKILEGQAHGYSFTVDAALGHLCVAHDGAITWDRLMLIKDAVWGEEAVAVEYYPARADVVNSGNYRHLWRLGAGEFVPDLLGAHPPRDTLECRHNAAWHEARHG